MTENQKKAGGRPRKDDADKKIRATIYISPEIYAKARELNINISASAAEGVEKAVMQKLSYHNK